jgi:flagellar hook protein FlgE
MEIQSAFSSGLQGFQKAQDDLSTAAENISASTSVNPEGSGTVEESNLATTEQNTRVNETPDLSQSVIDLKVAEFQGKASANVIQTADETLGTLLDVRA